jgi:outer membrane protein TolC
VDADEALAAAARRPDLRRRLAEAQRAEAEERVAAGAGRSDLDARLDYGRDDRDRVLTLGISVGLPLSGRGAGERAAAAAHASRMRGELAAGLRAAENDVRAAAAVHAGLAAAAAEAGDVSLELDVSTRLVLQRWEAGDLGLLDVLALRRELLATRLAWLDRRLDLALAALEVETLSGRLAEIAP